MYKLLRRSRYYLIALFFCVASFSAVIIIRPPKMQLYINIVLALGIAVFLLYLKIKQSVKAARLIIENQILHIEPAVIQQHTGEKIFLRPEDSVEVFVSCFGILLDTKIIKFNQQGIRLERVELDRDFIRLTYGTKQKVQSTKLLHRNISDAALAEISRRFLYETGITSTILHQEGASL